MKIAFAADPLDSFKIVKDSTFAIMTEAASRGHELYAFGHGDLLFDGHEVKASVSQITLTGKADDWYQQQAPVLRSLNEFDAVVERTDPPFDMEYVYATYMWSAQRRTEHAFLTGRAQFVVITKNSPSQALLNSLRRP